MIHKRTPYRREKQQKARGHALQIINLGGYNPFCGYFDGNHVKSLPKNSKYRKYLKRQSNKRLRQHKSPVQNSQYRRFLDYWWKLF